MVLPGGGLLWGEEDGGLWYHSSGEFLRLRVPVATGAVKGLAWTGQRLRGSWENGDWELELPRWEDEAPSAPQERLRLSEQKLLGGG